MPNKALIVRDQNVENSLGKVAVLQRRLAKIGWEVEYVTKSPKIPEEGVPIVPMGTLWDPKM